MIKLSATQTLQVVESTPEVLRVESTWTAGGEGKPPPRHYHPNQEEHFEVLEGELTVELAGEPPRVLRVGETLEVPRGTVHRMWNAGPVTARAAWRVTPRLGTEEMFRFVAEGMSPLRTATLLWKFRNEFRPALRS